MSPKSVYRCPKRPGSAPEWVYTLSDVDMVDEVKTCTSVSFGSFYLSTKALIVFHSYKERVVKQGTVVIL